MRGCYCNIPQAIFYLLKEDYSWLGVGFRVQGLEFKVEGGIRIGIVANKKEYICVHAVVGRWYLDINWLSNEPASEDLAASPEALVRREIPLAHVKHRFERLFWRFGYPSCFTTGHVRMIPLRSLLAPTCGV